MIIGIDTGTTNSLAAVWRNGQSELIPNALGKFLTPSVVCVDEDGMVLTGRQLVTCNSSNHKTAHQILNA